MQKFVSNASKLENAKYVDFIYAIGNKVMIIHKVADNKIKSKHVGLLSILQVHSVLSNIKIRQLMPYFE